ncbi:hypothetical protein SLEP1_g57942 [Rubroshorea leprosula]|uniref:Homeobox domain-containing protein n=1 Tax=Rubroshorea leprosula TaxID=152421 RepID=A0AAV5MN54_9ROSI|nr:hypothetical protein SLEP1_g57942 [Rubroshorea leprosula]
MEPQQDQNQQYPPNEDSSGSSSKGGSYPCRQSSTRWTPTTDQIRILKDLYYNNGVRSPSAEQIQRISARLRQYGKIEGKNVFYWFQNHKARERQKKRFTTSSDVPMQRSSVPNSPWKAEDPLIHSNKFPSITHPGYSPASSSSAGVLPVPQMGNYGYGSLNMEKSFRDCSISSSGTRNGVSISHGWVGIDPYYSSCSFFDKRKSSYGTLEQEQEDDEVEAGLQIETLPLFPIHGEGMNGFCSVKNDPDSFCGYPGSWYRADDGGNSGASRASLELSLNSYRSQDSI